MVLIDVREENGWLSSGWNLTYPAGWTNICKAVSSVFDFYADPEVLVGGERISVSDKDEILALEENSKMTIRGMSTIINCPLMITFYNQLQVVEVTLPCMADEFKEADYKQFNLSLGQYMDSIELAMHR